MSNNILVTSAPKKARDLPICKAFETNEIRIQQPAGFTNSRQIDEIWAEADRVWAADLKVLVLLSTHLSKTASL
jgi:hypothetical protein